MQKLDECVDFVNSQIKYHSIQASRNTKKAEVGDPSSKRKKENHLDLVRRFSELSDFLAHPTSPATSTEDIEGRHRVVSPVPHLTPQDLEGLPKEVLDELRITESDQLEMAIYAALKKAGGTLPVDKILIQLYWDTKVTHQRDKLNAKLYRMAQKGKIKAESETRGTYTLLDPASGNTLNQLSINLAEELLDQEADNKCGL